MMKDLRRLIYVPILHAREDSGRIASILHGNEKNDIKRGRIDKELSAVDEMWEGIAAKIEELNLPWNQTRIYQDGVPVCGNELEIITRLAESGSPNFLFILDLIQKKAKFEGTENIDLLIREYDLLNKLLMKNSDKDRKETIAEYQVKSRELLTVRDKFILKRITSTLQKGELPIVFMGVMHLLDKMLETDFLVSYVIYRLPFRSIGAIYNA
ncbi:MAG: hypothetical protein M0Q51_16425 [Bacteroidales bacterium]|nr:hypothetical protein [Bacteroidales bacterium]